MTLQQLRAAAHALSVSSSGLIQHAQEHEATFGRALRMLLLRAA